MNKEQDESTRLVGPDADSTVLRSEDETRLVTPSTPPQPRVIDDTVDTDEEEYEYEDRSIRGWLVVFLALGVGVGVLLTIYNVYTMLHDNYLNSNVEIFGYATCISAILLGGYTIYAFLRHQVDAVAAGLAYTLNVGLDGVMAIVLIEQSGLGFANDELIGTVVKPLLWCVIWTLFLLCSSRVRSVIPPRTRQMGWKAPVMGLVMAVSIIGLYTSMISMIKDADEVNKEYEAMMADILDDAEYEQTAETVELPEPTAGSDYVAFIDQAIERTSLPVNQGGVIMQNIERRGNYVIYTFKVPTLDKSALTSSELSEIRAAMRRDLVNALDGNVEYNDFDKAVALGGYDVKYIYRDANNSQFAVIEIPNSDLRRYIK